LSENDATAVECFDPEGLPIFSRGNNDKSASNVLSSIFKHARIITEDEDPVVVIERERSVDVLGRLLYVKEDIEDSLMSFSIETGGNIFADDRWDQARFERNRVYTPSAGVVSTSGFLPVRLEADAEAMVEDSRLTCLCPERPVLKYQPTGPVCASVAHGLGQRALPCRFLGMGSLTQDIHLLFRIGSTSFLGVQRIGSWAPLFNGSFQQFEN
uniref:Late endosomal/lysosomal adaptor and MAPK and MTOR activator 5 n=1 Tax=Schistocephalus solidus TaxID=70667 RepID=A0A183S9N8_SCHSO